MTSGRCVLCALSLTMLAGCTSEAVTCGGDVSPKALAARAPNIVEQAKRDAASFCVRSNGGCDFTMARTRDGWSVAATFRVERDGKCLFRIGDQRFYLYDEAGVLQRVINGL